MKRNKTVNPEDKKVVRRLFQEMGRIKGGIAMGVFISVSIIVCNMFAPKLLSDIINQANVFYTAKQNGVPFEGNLLQNVDSSLKWLSVIYVMVAALYYAKMYTLNNVVSRHFTCGIRIDISDKIARVPVSFVDRTRPGEVLSRMTNDVSNMGGMVHNLLDIATMGLLQIVGIAIMMFIVSWQLALLTICLVPLSLFMSDKLATKSDKYYHDMYKVGGKLHSYIEETYGGYVTVKAYNLEEQQCLRFLELVEQHRELEKKATFYSSIVQPIIAFTNGIAYAAICLVGGYFAIEGKLSLGAVVAVVLYAKQFSGPLEQLAGGLGSLQRVKAAGGRVYGMLDEKEMEPINGEMPSNIEGNVEFKDVCFSYNKDNPLIEGFNCSVKRGQKVAIVGPTGAGKTTLVNLLMRFYDIDSGSITVDGVDISKVSRESVRNLFSMVLQDTWLLSGTVYENVAYGKDNVSKEEVMAACDSAYCDHFIRTLPNGYDTEINESSTNISGGQKQLLTIARALLSDRALLILDEATSNVDTRTEILIQKAMDKLMSNKTCFVIAHRLSTIVDADMIIVINKGSIVEIGKHQELLDKNGFYCELFNSQYNIQ